MESERRSQRYPSHGALQIRCETWIEFVETYASDICRGGMFIRSDETPPEVLSEIELKLLLPGGMEVALRARVVHVVAADVAERQNRTAGMGVEFIHADAEQKRQILQLVEFARTQGDGSDPNASFTRTLLETSPSMPASDVAAKLSTMPDGSGDAVASRIRKASQTAMQAVQLNDDVGHPERSDPSQVAVRARAMSAPLDRQPTARAATGPLTDSTGRSSVNTPIVRTPTQPIVRTPTGPLTSATGRSSVNTPIVRTPTQPIVRTPTGPLTGATGRSSVNTPIVRTPTGPLTAAGSRPNSAPVRTPTGPLGPSSAKPNQPVERAQSGPLDGSPGSPSGNPDGSASAPAPSPSAQPLAPPKPTDLNRLKIVVNGVAHKHYEAAAREARDMLIDNPGDPQVLKWQAICFARMALARDEPAAAIEFYEKVLRYEESNREAREFVKTFQRDKKLSSLPFGRYFVKKK
jgi:uncharacterized protein (TIGR02266 family)